MSRAWGLLLLFSIAAGAAESEWSFENTNFLLNSREILSNDPYTYDYNRLRMTGTLDAGSFFFTLIADNETFAGADYLESAEYALARQSDADTPFDTRTSPWSNPEAENRLRLYRLYGEYTNDRHMVTAGLMRVSFGVGRIWTPVDFFNPLNSFSIETTERDGVFGLQYAYALSNLSSLQLVTAQNRDGEAKSALRLKGYLPFGDTAVLAYNSPSMDFIGYEFDARVGETDLAFRSEGGRYHDKTLDESYIKYILGADYGWENSLMILVEYLYNGLPAASLLTLPEVNAHQDEHYLGIMATYQPTPLWSLAATVIRNLDDASAFLSPSAVYSLSDESTLTLGLIAFSGEAESEFGAVPDTYYLSWYYHF